MFVGRMLAGNGGTGVGRLAPGARPCAAPGGVVLGLAAALAFGPGPAVGPAGAAGQSLTAGAVAGEVSDGSSPMAGVPVSIREAGGSLRRVQQSDADGRFRFELLPPGEYLVSAERLGYRPARRSGVRVRSGGTAQVALELTEATPPVEEADERAHGERPLARPGGGQGTLVGALALRGLPPGTGHWTDVTRFPSLVGEDGGILGLPADLTGFAVDGLPSSVPRQPTGQRGALAGMAHPAPFLEELAVLDLPYDVEWSGGPGGMIHATTVRGSPDLRYDVRGTLTASGLRSGPGLPDELPSHADLEASALVTGPVIPDTAHFAVGLQTRRRAEPTAPFFHGDRPSDEALAMALSQGSGDALAPFWSTHVATLQATSAFGRGDWQLAEDHVLSARAHLAGTRDTDADLAPLPLVARGTTMNGWDAQLSAWLTSRVTHRVSLEVRGGLDLWNRAYAGREFSDDEAGFSAAVPPTTTASTGRVLGSNPLGAAETGERVLRSAGTVHVRAGDHRIKAGVDASRTNHRVRPRRERDGAFRFGGSRELVDRRGGYHALRGGEEEQRFDVTELGVFAQDTWRPLPGLEVTGGIRLDRLWLPLGDVALAEEWLRRTGVDNTALADSAVTERVSPRLAFRWDVEDDGRWIVEGGAGIFSQPPHPGVLDEVLRYTGDVEALRGVGSLGRWPEEPEGEVESAGTVLSLLGPRFEGPRTQRGSLGLEVHLLDNLSARLSVTAARTDFLPRRRDLNRREEPREEDQFGRPLFGTLVQEGGLLEVEPGSDRRLAGFDVVSGLEADGWSEGVGVTLGVEHRVPDLVELSASYTLADATDNRPGGAHAGPPAGVPAQVEGPADGWAEGPSDLMVRHRAAAVGELTLPLPVPVRVGARYRGRSGIPFTPQLPAGVRAGGHVAGGVEPAYLVSVPDVEDLARRWGCLADGLGVWAERNACRGPSSHDLDLRLTVGLLDGDGATVELVADAVNVLERNAAVPDPALFLVDPTRELDREPEAGTVVVPLRVNPRFGQPLYRGASTREFRVGVRARF